MTSLLVSVLRSGEGMSVTLSSNVRSVGQYTVSSSSLQEIFAGESAKGLQSTETNADIICVGLKSCGALVALTGKSSKSASFLRISSVLVRF